MDDKAWQDTATLDEGVVISPGGRIALYVAIACPGCGGRVEVIPDDPVTICDCGYRLIAA